MQTIVFSFVVVIMFCLILPSDLHWVYDFWNILNLLYIFLLNKIYMDSVMDIDAE